VNFFLKGFIEKTEAETIVQSLYKCYGENVSVSSAKKQVDKLMSKFDKDNNGLLSEQEFVNGCMNDEELLKFFLPNK
jgi:Ca2+-binding EF-hand superfamily protein